MRILAVTPTYGGQMRSEMRESLAAQYLDGMELEWMVLDDQPYDPPDHRNVLHMYRQARERALAEKFDVMWTVEHDVVLPREAALRLAVTPGDVAFGVYMVRWGDYIPNIIEYVNDKNLGEPLSVFPEKMANAERAGMVRCGGVGWGCTWIRRKALQRIDFPKAWPENPPYDISFAQRAVRSKVEMWANLNVRCGHIKNGVELSVRLDDEITYNGSAWMVGGQLLPMYKVVKRRKPAIKTAEPVKKPAEPDKETANRRYTPPPVETVEVLVSSKCTEQLVEVVTLQTIYARIDGESRKMRYGVRYDMPASVAHELARAGYVEIRHALS